MPYLVYLYFSKGMRNHRASGSALPERQRCRFFHPSVYSPAHVTVTPWAGYASPSAFENVESICSCKRPAMCELAKVKPSTLCAHIYGGNASCSRQNSLARRF